MMRWLILVFVVLSLLTTGVVLAQPESIMTVLADLNTRLGTSLTLDQLDDWRWSESLYPDTSLGCPQADVMYAQVVTRGYQFILTYSGTAYDYRADEAGNFFLCTTTTIALTPVPTLAPVFESPSGDAITTDSASAVAEVARINADLRPLLAWSPAGDRLVTAGLETDENPTPALLIYDSASPTTPVDRLEMAAPVTALMWGALADGLFIVTGHNNGAIVVTPYGVTPGEAYALATDPTTIAPIIGLAISQDGAAIASITQTAEGQSRIDLWDTVSGSLVGSYLSAQPVQTLIFTADDLQLALGDNAGSLTFIRREDRSIVTTASVSNRPITALAASPITTVPALLAVGTDDGLTRLFSLETGRIVGMFDNGTQDAVLVLDFNTDGTLLASAGGRDADAVTVDNAIRLWNVQTLGVIKGLLGHEAAVRAVSFSPDDRQLASLSEDGVLRLWAVTAAG